MMDCERLSSILKDGESSTLELKSSKVLAMADKHKSELVRTMTSLANLKGGWLIIGVDDACMLEQCDFSGQMDEITSRIDNLNRDRCSPPVSYSPQHLKCPDGDVIVLKILRRKGIPHAVIKRKADRIRQREYYLRAHKGKQLVSDFQLREMFQSVDFPEVAKRFDTSITYSRNKPGLVAPFEIPSYLGDIGFSSFFDSLSEEMHERLLSQEAQDYPRLLAELMPYCILKLLGERYSSSWRTRVVTLGMASLIESLPSESEVFGASDLPSPVSGSLLAALGVDTIKPFSKRFAIALPEGSSISIRPFQDRMSSATSRLVISKDDYYDAAFVYRGTTWNRGGPSDHPRSAELGELISLSDLIEWSGDVSTIRGELSIQCGVEIGYEEHELDSYYEWLLQISGYLESFLSWSRFLTQLPPRKLYAIHGDVKRSLSLLQDLAKHARNRSDI